MLSSSLSSSLLLPSKLNLSKQRYVNNLYSMDPSIEVQLNCFLLCILVLRQDPPASSCSVCLDGAEFEYGSRQMPGTEDTCDSMQGFLDTFPEWDCDLLHEIIFSINDFIDVPSFCGCVGAPIPNLCDSCDDHTTAETTRSVSFHADRSCNDLEIVYPFVTDAYRCQDLREACCYDAPSDVNQECGVCAPGSYIGTPDLQVPYFGSHTSCASIDSDLSFFPASSCSGFRDQVNSLFDVAALCACDGASPPNFCSFCDDDESMVDPDFEIAGSGGLTCATAASLARFVTDPTMCNVEFAAMSRGCCRSEDRCSICPGGSSVGRPERPYVFNDQPITCSDFEFQIGFLAPQECEAFNDGIPIDMASWCGCEGATSPKECSLCPDGYVVANENVEIPDSNGVTCGLAAELAQYIVDQQFCEESVSVLGGECCKPAPPTSAPTADPDESSGTTNALPAPFVMTFGGIFYLAFW
jgi:hypothetical protein